MYINTNNLNFLNQFYKGSERIEYYSGPIDSWAAGKALEVKPPTQEELNHPESRVKFDFSKTGKDEETSAEGLTLQELTELLKSVQGAYGDHLLAEINPSEAMKKQAAEAIENKRLENGLSAKKEYDGKEIEWDPSIYNTIDKEDSQLTLHHRFATDSFRTSFIQSFDQAAVGYAKYLNQNIESEYDDVIYHGFSTEKNYYKVVKQQMKEEAHSILSYFNYGQEKEYEVDALADQLATVTIEYAKQVASGDRDRDHLQSRLEINGVSMSITQLIDAQKILSKYNEQGIRGFYREGGRYQYCALGSNYDVTGFEELGTMSAKVKKDTNNLLSGELANMVFHTYQKRVDNTIKEFHGDEGADRLRFDYYNGAKHLAAKVGNYGIIIDGMSIMERATKIRDDPNSYSYYKYKGSIFEAAYEAAYKNEMMR